MIISATLDITAVQGYYSICHNKLTLENVFFMADFVLSIQLKCIY